MSAEGRQIIFSMVNVSKIHPPQKQVLKDIYLSFYYGAKIGVIGLNGSGKSSLLRIIAGVDKDYIGEVHFSPGYSIGMLEQEPKLDETKTVMDIVKEGVKEINDTLREYEEVNNKFSEPMTDDEMTKLIDKQSRLSEKIELLDAWNIESRLERAMDALQCPEGDTPVSVLSGGERRRVALCRLLLQQPDILLLDEPTNHLDAESVLWLENHLQSYPGTIISVTHDRYFLDNVAGWILELDRGEGIPWKGNAERIWSESWSGCVKVRREDNRNRKRVWRITKRCWVKM
jgi:ATPase subunit of ABC transporter with duplicated ATPase domains